MSDLFKHIEQPTAQVNTGQDLPADGFQLSASDFDQTVLASIPPEPAPIPGAIPGQPAPPAGKPPFDAEFTTEFIIDFFDGTQEPLFYFLNQNRKRKKYFGTRDEYLEAVKLSYLTDDEIREQFPDDYEAKRTLVVKLNEFNKRMTKIKDGLPFTDDEKEQLERPLTKLVEKAGLDIPPGLAMVMVVSKIMSSRIIDLYAD